MPARKIIVGKMLGKDAVREIENVPLSNTTINRLIDDLFTVLKRCCLINGKIRVYIYPG
jgi:hypothetical protein